jgi:hypothetical protein
VTPTDDVPSTPAAYNTVIGVGGTALHLNPDATRASEEVWNENGQGDIWGFNLGAELGAAGSGCSLVFNARAWQTHVAGYTGLGCGSTRRSTVDIAAIADPYTGYDIFETTASWCPSGSNDGNGNACPNSDPEWQTLGGTSLASPVIGAMWGLAGGPGSVTYPSLSLYGHFKGDSSHPLYDVTVGGTGMCDWATPGFCTGGSNPNGWVSGQHIDCGWSTTNTSDPTYLANRFQCYARPGYDGVAGVGTPKGLNAFKAMNPKANIKSPGTVTHGVTHTFSASGSSDPFPGGHLTFVWNWGDGHSTTTTSLTAGHKYASAHTRTITLTVTDNYGRTGSKSLTITVH